jgi:hypothetical protein
MSYDRDLREWKRTQREIKMKGVAPKNVAFEDRDNTVPGFFLLFTAWLLLVAAAVAILGNCSG